VLEAEEGPNPVVAATCPPHGPCKPAPDAIGARMPHRPHPGRHTTRPRSTLGPSESITRTAPAGRADVHAHPQEVIVRTRRSIAPAAGLALLLTMSAPVATSADPPDPGPGSAARPDAGPTGEDPTIRRNTVTGDIEFIGGGRSALTNPTSALPAE